MYPALDARHLLGLPVETKSGQHLGKVQNFEVDPETQSILRYTVRGDKLLQELFGQELIIQASQVISVTKERMTVDDLVVRDAEPVVAPSPVTPGGGT